MGLGCPYTVYTQSLINQMDLVYASTDDPMDERLLPASKTNGTSKGVEADPLDPLISETNRVDKTDTGPLEWELQDAEAGDESCSGVEMLGGRAKALRDDLSEKDADCLLQKETCRAISTEESISDKDRPAAEVGWRAKALREDLLVKDADPLRDCLLQKETCRAMSTDDSISDKDRPAAETETTDETPAAKTDAHKQAMRPMPDVFVPPPVKPQAPSMPAE